MPACSATRNGISARSTGCGCRTRSVPGIRKSRDAGAFCDHCQPTTSIRRHTSGAERRATGRHTLSRGNEGAGIIHRSPQVAPGVHRLNLRLDWRA
ncbi:DUF1826 domain-containing protein [Stutzerimonas stutzeri]|uniref:DUF1826 domain-containing protein n=1 Tax=Stutzerimonas stutzeri TaxID=316 RepID=UPI0009B6E65E